MKNILIAGCAMILATGLFASAVSAGGDIDRTKRPQGKPTPVITLPKIQKATLSNGLAVWLVERHELPTVAFNLVIMAGSDHDPADLPGLASMTADVIDEGTTTRTSLQISDEMESVGAMFGINSSVDASSATLNVLSKYLDKALDVYADVLSNPVFPDKEFQRLRKQRTTVLLQQKDQPTTIANNVYSHILYGDNHPYGANPAGTEASLTAMTTADLKKFYSAYYRPNNATLIVVGDATLGDLKPKLETALAGWKPADVPAYTVPPPPPAGPMTIYLVDKPGAPQSEIRIGYPALQRNTPDFFPVSVMNRLLGGQFTSRINLNLRERHGYTYGARSSFSFQKGVGPFTASSGVTTEKTDSSVHEFLHEIDLMRTGGMTAEELAYVKKGIVGNFTIGFETAAQISQSLGSIAVYGLPEDYYSNYLQNVEGVSTGDIARVAAAYLDTSKMAIVVVGDLAKIRAGIEALRLGRVVICGSDGKPL
jgi:zinc protease